MLVLQRKTGQRLRVGNATITVVSIKGGSIRLGIDAPPETIVLRDDAKRRQPPQRT